MVSTARVVTILRYGETSLLCQVDSEDSGWLANAARELFFEQLQQVLPTPGQLLLTFHTPAQAAAAERLLGDLTDSTSTPTNPRIHRFATRFTGPDLPAVADLSGMSSEAVVRVMCEATLRVSFFGFAPGFAYLTGLPQQLQLPRRAQPRTSVPAGSVAIAGGYAAVYPRSSPGGWHLLGTTRAELWQQHKDPPSLLASHDLVQFYEQ